ncbi:MAG: hypothetical protein J07HX64_01364 [halophilic archaeon J07HX64]|jgi:hypothetical protein|nr:MAG: hypothetical protein J07HX64_01364 [halophilic archaeon J07HX64]
MLYDSSTLIDYLDGRDIAVECIESHLDERAVATQLVLFEMSKTNCSTLVRRTSTPSTARSGGSHLSRTKNT